MRSIVFTVLAGAAVTVLSAQAPATTGFKLGTFERKDTPFVGVVLRDAVVIDLAAADAAVTPAPSVAAPRDMKDLIARYDKGVRGRILELIARVNAAGAVRPSWVLDLSSLKTLPPIMYPQTMLNMAVNYREHALEMGGAATSPTGPGAALPGTKSAPGIWERQADDTRWNPYLFTKLPSAVIAAGESIQLPAGRTQIDWECELGVVIGARASRVGADLARDYIFGYTIENDVSDRGGRGDTRHGSDWLIAKSHDTFAPMGPFIVPKEFVPDPQKLKVDFQAQRAGDAGRQHVVDDRHGRRAGVVRLAHPDAAARRRDRHRQPGRRRLGPESADFSQGGRHLGMHLRGRWDAEESGRGAELAVFLVR